MSKSKVSLIRCPDYVSENVEKAVRQAVELLGGPQRFVQKGQKVLIKPNLLSDVPPEACVDTHPEIVRAVIRLFKPLASQIYCGDSPSVWGEKKDVERVYEISGMKAVCREEHIEMVPFIVPKKYKGYALTDWLDKTDVFINVPKFKTHGYTVLTAGVKNLFGLIVGMNKMKIHGECPNPGQLSHALLDIYEAARPGLTVLDGIMAMEGEGPGSSGTPRPMNLVAAAEDALALDFVLAGIMGIAPGDIPTIKVALARGLAPKSLLDINIQGEEISSFAVKDFHLPRTSFLTTMPQWCAVLVRKLLSMKVEILREKCRVCRLCSKTCPAGACHLRGGHMVIDHDLCIFCLCCQEVCPHKAVEVRKNFFMRMMTR